MPRSLILASGSPYRLQLLKEAGYEVTPVASAIVEPELLVAPDLEEQLLSLACAKALTVADRGFTGLILAADTVSLVNDEILGKPTDEADARRMLTLLVGHPHEVWTAWVFLRTDRNQKLHGVEKTKLVFRPWKPGELDDYLASGEWAGKCGAYGLRLPDDPLLTEIIGSTSNVIGLPLERFAQLECERPDFFED
ncbi:MAG: nucleoside triphosphate pyrophosphatase [Planctomycetales bacterium]